MLLHMVGATVISIRQATSTHLAVRISLDTPVNASDVAFDLPILRAAGRAYYVGQRVGLTINTDEEQ